MATTENKQDTVQETVQAAAAEENTGVVVLELKKPLEYEGRTYERLTLDLESLTGKDSIEVETELMMRKKGAVIFGALNNDYILGIAGKACQEKIGVDAFLRLGLKDFNRLVNAVRNFLLK